MERDTYTRVTGELDEGRQNVDEMRVDIPETAKLKVHDTAVLCRDRMVDENAR